MKFKTTNKSQNKRGPRTTRTTHKIKRFGGLHAGTIGTSTRDQTDAERDREAIESFNAALQEAITETFGQA